MAQNAVQNSSYLFPEDIIVYAAAVSTTVTTLANLQSSGVTWTNIGALTEFSVEGNLQTVTPASINVEHNPVISMESEKLTITLQEQNPTVIDLLMGGIVNTVSTSNTAIGLTAMDVGYFGGASTVAGCMIWTYAKWADGRSLQTYYPYCVFTGGGALTPKGRDSGEFQDRQVVLEARQSTSVVVSNRRVYKIEVLSTNTT